MASPGGTPLRSTKMASPGGTLTIAANTLLITSQVILCLGSPTAHDSRPALTSPHASSFHHTLTSLHTSSPHRDFTNQHTGPQHSVTSQKMGRRGSGLSLNDDGTEVIPAGEALRRSTWLVASTEGPRATGKLTLTEGHPNKFLSTGLSRFSQALNPTSPLNLQAPRLRKSTWKSGEKSLMNMNEIEGVSVRQGERNDDEDLVRKSKNVEFAQHKNGSRPVPIRRLPHGLDSSSSSDTHSSEAQTTASGDRNTFKTWELSSNENCFFTLTKDEMPEEVTVNAPEKVTDNATNGTGEANVRIYGEFRRLSPAAEGADDLASIESLPASRSRGELSPLPSLTRLSGPPVTRSHGKRPAFLRVSEMMVNSMRSLEQEYPIEESILEQDDPSEERQLQQKDTIMTRYIRPGIRKQKNQVDQKINEDLHLEQEHTSEENYLKQEHPSEEHHLEHKHTSKEHNIQQIINKEHHLQKVRASGAPPLDAVMATSDVASGGHKTTTGFSSPVLNYHIKVGVDGPSATTAHHQLHPAHTRLQHPAHINEGSYNSVLTESSPDDTQTSHKAVSKWRKTSFAKRRKKASLTKSDETFLGTRLTSSPNNVTTKLLRGNYTEGFLETNDNVTKTSASPTACSSTGGGCSAEESARTGGREQTQLVTAPRPPLQPLEPKTGREAPQHDDEAEEERLLPFPEKYDFHHTSKVKERLQLQGHANQVKDQEQVVLELSQETLAEDKIGGGDTARRAEGRNEGSETHKQKILVSSPDTKHKYLRPLTSGLEQPSQTKPEVNIEDLTLTNKRQQSGEKNERTRPQAGSPLDLHDTSHLKDPQKRRIKKNAAMVPDGMADAALVPDEGSGAPAPNITKYLPGRYHSLLQTRSREIFRGLGTESRSGTTARGTRQDGSAGVAEMMNGSRASPEDAPRASMNSSQDLHIPGDFGVLRETHQGILSSLGSQPDKNTNETSQLIPPGVNHGPDYSYLPPGFSGIDNGRGCNCWQTHDDSFMKEIECRCQGEHVVQLPANLSTNVDRLTLTKTGVESLGHQNLSQYKSALQELILRDAKDLRKMETDCFREMKRLRTIYISHAPRLVTLPPHIFHAFLPSLKVLRIVYTGLAELPSLTQLATNSIIHMVDLENNKIRRIRGSSVNIRTEQLLLDNNMLHTVEARAFHGSQIGKLSMKGNLRLTDLHPLAFKGLKSLISLDLSETGISHLPTVGLEGLETLRLVRTYNLKVFPSVYSFKSITTAELTYHYHCCAFKFPKLHDPAEHKKHEEFLRRMEKEQCSEVTSASSVTSASQVGLGRRRRRVAPEPHPSPQPPVVLEPHPTGLHSPHQPQVPPKPHLARPPPSPRPAAIRRDKTADTAEADVRSSMFHLPSDTEDDYMHSPPPPLLRHRPFPSLSFSTSPTSPPSRSPTSPPSTSPTPPPSTSPTSPPSTSPTPSLSTSTSPPPLPPPSTPSSQPSRLTTPEGPDVSNQDLFVLSRAYEAKKILGEEKVVIIGAGGPAPRPRQYYLQGQHHKAEGGAEGRGGRGTLDAGPQRLPPTECQNGRCTKDHNPGLQQQTSDREIFISRATIEPMPGTPDDSSGHGDEDSGTGRDRPVGPVRLQMGLDVFIDVHRGGSGGRGTSSSGDGGVDKVGWVNTNSGGVPVSHWALGAGDTRHPTVRDRIQRVASTKMPAAVEDPSEAEDIISGFSEHEGGFSNLGFSEMDNFGFPEHHGFDMDDGLGTHLSSYPGGGVGVGGFSLDDDHGFPDDYDPDECVNGLCPKTARLPPHGPGYPFDPNNHFDPNYPFEPVEVFHSSDVFRPVVDTSVEGTTGDHTGSPHGKFHNKVSLSQGIRTVCRGNLSKNYRDVQCLPEPDAFNPCEDIMGNVGLRVAVWLVVVTAVFGNLAVMVVLMSTRFKMTVSKFLMCNLAGADLCMGLYLLIIAAMDLRTIGVYFNYAIDWQNGPGCKVAGFLTVFASELSILTLTVITLERWYAITYAIHLNKRLRLSVAVRVMVLAWLYALTMATLPLLGVSGYSKTSICLPMETVDGGDQVYLLILLITNGLAFILICVCYAKMYCSIAGNNLAANTSDTTVAKRMALLVFTDFACWAPIAFFGLTAVSGYPLISVTHAKFLLVFFYPLNSCANPYLYAILTKQYRRDLFILLARHGFCTKRAMKYKGGYSTNTWLNHHNVCVSGGTGGGSGGPSRRISTLTQITTCGDWRSRVRDGSEESLGRQCSPSRARSISAELTVPSPMTMGLTDRRLSDLGRRLQPVAEVRDGRASPKPGSLAPTSGSPHPIKNCYARMSFTPEQEALLLRYASDRQPSVTPANARRRTSPSDRDEAVPLSIYTPTTPDTITTPISPQLDHSV